MWQTPIHAPSSSVMVLVALQDHHKQLSRGSLQAILSPREDVLPQWQGKGGIRGQACLQPVLLVVWLSESHAHPWVPVTPEKSTSSTVKKKPNNLFFNSSGSLESLILKQNTLVMMSLGQRHIKDQKVQQELFRDSSFLAVELPHFQTQSL